MEEAGKRALDDRTRKRNGERERLSKSPFRLLVFFHSSSLLYPHSLSLRFSIHYRTPSQSSSRLLVRSRPREHEEPRTVAHPISNRSRAQSQACQIEREKKQPVKPSPQNRRCSIVQSVGSLLQRNTVQNHQDLSWTCFQFSGTMV